jgi:hypothetical protein
MEPDRQGESSRYEDSIPWLVCWDLTQIEEGMRVVDVDGCSKSRPEEKYVHLT